MRSIQISLIGLGALVVLAMSPASFGQYRDMLGQPWASPLQATMSTMIWNKINQHSITGSYGKPTKGRAATSSTSSSDQYPSTPIIDIPSDKSIPFKSTGTRLILQEMVETLGGTPQDKVENKELITGIIDRYDANAKAMGYPNDLALALVSYIDFNNSVYNEKPLLPSERKMEMRNMLAANAGQFNHLSDRQKQETYEFFVMWGGLTHYYYEDAKRKKNAEDLQTCKMLAARNLKGIGIEP